jgi:Ser-tRNA(Ala) deacylase AlaX
MRKVFWEDPYLTRWTTRVARVEGEFLWLDSSIFFAFSGGQESDAGTIGGYVVESAEKDDLDIVYRLSPDHSLQMGQDVAIEIDWIRRYNLMRLHFAAEMVLQIIYQEMPGITRIGAHIAADKARIDFASDVGLAPILSVVQARADALIHANAAIITDYSDVQLQRRFWSVEGFAQMTCGGTHPRSTGEVGPIALKRRNPGKGKERVEIALGL